MNGKSIRRTSPYALSVYSLKIEKSGWPGIVGGVRFAGPFGNPGNKSLLDDYTEVFSHELVETVSDPFLDGVRLLPKVQAARSIADDSNELNDFAQSFDPAPYRRMSIGLSVSPTGPTGTVQESYPNVIRTEMSIQPESHVRRSNSCIDISPKYKDISILTAVIHHRYLQVAKLLGLGTLGRAKWHAIAVAVAEIAVSVAETKLAEFDSNAADRIA